MTGKEIRKVFTEEELNTLYNIVSSVLDEEEEREASISSKSKQSKQSEKNLKHLRNLMKKNAAFIKERTWEDAGLNENDLGDLGLEDMDDYTNNYRKTDDFIESVLRVFLEKCCSNLLAGMESRTALLELLDGKTHNSSDIYFKLLYVTGHIDKTVLHNILMTLANTAKQGNDKKQIWINNAVKIPYNIIKPIADDINSIADCIDKKIYGMAKCKRKIIDAIVLKHYSSASRVEPLLLVGEPGTGKTHISTAIAEALKLPIIKIQLAGSYDVASIRGSASSWSSGQVGLLFSQFLLAGCENPVVLFDEIDKAGGSSAGQIINVLTEVLDITQNHSYTDTFMSIPVNLSKAFIICTANDINLIPAHILDRCNIIDVDNYSKEEKIHIIKQHLPAQVLNETSLQKYRLNISDIVAIKLAELHSLRTIKICIKSLLINRLRSTKNNTAIMLNDNDIDTIDISDYKSKNKACIGFNRFQ